MSCRWRLLGGRPEMLPTRSPRSSVRTAATLRVARLCRYLLENSATEFPASNFNAAFACLSGEPRQTKNLVTYERLDARVSANGAVGVREEVEVWLELKPNAENGTMQLDVGVTVPPPHTTAAAPN